MKKIVVLLYVVSVLTNQTMLYAPNAKPVRAVVQVPATDLVGEPLRKNVPASTTLKAYKKLPLCGISPSSPLCPRTHQLLFNEVVEIIAEQDNQVQIQIPQLFFITQADKHPHTTYWMLREHLMPLSKIEAHGVDITTIPQPVSFTNQQPTNKQTIVTLLTPWHDDKNNRTFSAGTRFVAHPAEHSPNTYAVFILNPCCTAATVYSIPRQFCLLQNPAKTPQACIQDFVRIVRTWAHLEEGFIPYVWGGCSVIGLIPFNETFSQVELYAGKLTDTGYAYPTSACQFPKTGLDCTGLVARAAQLSGIPYFLKNSTTIATYLESLGKKDTLHDGDLIWVPGHVMVVSNVAKNLLVEARHYSQGYGKVHEIELGKVFSGMTTYQDLINAYEQKKSIQRMNKDGAIKNTYKNWKLLKMASAWNIMCPI